MALLALNNIDISYGSTHVLKDVSFAIEDGEIGCILGPSGSGKTSLLRAIAGFIDISQGSIYIAEQLMSSANASQPVNNRQVGLVFQDYALFPHLTVFENVMFGLKNIADLTSQQKKERAQQYLKLMDISGFANSFPADLSGGQQQRVAIARAIAPEPKLLLMDEAFSSLDPLLREQVAQDLRKVIKDLGLTAILVTHDQTEAFAFSDKIAVVANGKLQQFSTAYELYHQPKTMFVANFIGEGVFINGDLVLQNNAFFVKTSLGNLTLDPQQIDQLKQSIKYVEETKINDSNELKVIKSGLTILLRPDDIIHDDESIAKAIIVKKQFRGAFIRYELLLNQSQERILCFAPSHHNHEIGETFGIKAEVDHLICFATN